MTVSPSTISINNVAARGLSRVTIHSSPSVIRHSSPSIIRHKRPFIFRHSNQPRLHPLFGLMDSLWIQFEVNIQKMMFVSVFFRDFGQNDIF
jgi:hypothetical protein